MEEKNLQQQVNELRDEISRMKSDRFTLDHQHTGFDFTKIEWSDLASRKFFIHHTIPGALAGSLQYYGNFWIAPFACVLLSCAEQHQTAATDAGSVTLTIEKLTGTQALNSGVDMLSSTFDLKGTINTVVTKTPTLILADRTLKKGDRLAMKDSGVLSPTAHVTVVLELMMI